ncbi:hypothetical protein AB0M35_15050 [Micromonospora sp. NPDC051196]|uniref:hypothetical protein n=1 Tax=Micromonospora sp. NPDC051196 TaxID=3155281 RepID=UPI0034386D36
MSQSTTLISGGSASWSVDETIHLLREQWHLLVQNDKLFGPEYALTGVTKQLTAITDFLPEVPRGLRPGAVRLAAQYAESAAWLHQCLDEAVAGNRWTQQAFAWAEQIDDPIMTAWVTYRSSQQRLTSGHPTHAVEQANTALRYVLRQLAQLGTAINRHQQLPEVRDFLHDLQGAG